MAFSMPTKDGPLSSFPAGLSPGRGFLQIYSVEALCNTHNVMSTDSEVEADIKRVEENFQRYLRKHEQEKRSALVDPKEANQQAVMKQQEQIWMDSVTSVASSSRTPSKSTRVAQTTYASTDPSATHRGEKSNSKETTQGKLHRG
jgi:hypothetical protein